MPSGIAMKYQAMLFCLREPHESAAPCHRTTQPEVEAAVSHEASDAAERQIGSFS